MGTLPPVQRYMWGSQPSKLPRRGMTSEGSISVDQLITDGAGKGARPGAAASAQDRESAATVGAETENGEVGVKRCRALDSQAAHHGEAGAVHDGKILVAPGDAHLPRRFQVCRTHGLNGGHAVANSFREMLRGLPPDPVPEQCPGFDQYMVGGDQGLARREDSLRASVARIRGVRRRVPNRSIDE